MHQKKIKRLIHKNKNYLYLKNKSKVYRMEDKFIKEFENFYDNQLLKDYGNKIQTEIINELEDLRKRNDDFSERIICEESRLWSNLINDFNKDNSKEKVKMLTKLIEIYTCFSGICRQMNYTRDNVKHIKSLINRE